MCSSHRLSNCGIINIWAESLSYCGPNEQYYIVRCSWYLLCCIEGLKLKELTSRHLPKKRELVKIIPIPIMVIMISKGIICFTGGFTFEVAPTRRSGSQTFCDVTKGTETHPVVYWQRSRPAILMRSYRAFRRFNITSVLAEKKKGRFFFFAAASKHRAKYAVFCFVWLEFSMEIKKTVGDTQNLLWNVFQVAAPVFFFVVFFKFLRGLPSPCWTCFIPLLLDPIDLHALVNAV